MIFQKPSTRTRVSFEVGMVELGGHALHLAAGELQLGRGETVKDTAMVLSRYLDAIMIRTFAQDDVDELARHGSIPVINGLDRRRASVPGARRRDDDPRAVRPDRGRPRGVRRGREQRVRRRSVAPPRLLGMGFVVATPPGYEPPLDRRRA